MEYLIKNGIKFGSGGITHTTARHRRNYYLTESRQCMKLLNKYRNKTIKQVLIMPTRKDFRIDVCTDCLRITRVDIPGNFHTHVKSKRLAETIINNVCSEKIPLHSHSRTLECMKRLSDNQKFIKKIDELLTVRKKKGKKQSYFNPTVKKSFQLH